LVVVLDTATRRGLVDSAYNERRQQCEAAARYFGVPALRDVDLETFSAGAAEMEPLTRRRARHVVAENQRTLDAVEAMRQDDPTRLGLLMNSSHNSLRDDFEVSRWELDLIVNLAQQHPACYGARMTGAGFGGCAVALVSRDGVIPFSQRVAQDYLHASGLQPKLYVCEATNGAEVIFSRL
jgi:galactokinase